MTSRYYKRRKPKTLKSATLEVRKLETSIQVESRALDAVKRLNQELDQIEKNRHERQEPLDYGDLPQSLLDKVTGRRRETKEGKWQLQKSKLEEEKFNSLKRFYPTIIQSSLHSREENISELTFKEFREKYHAAPEYGSRGYPIKTCGSCIENIITSLKKQLDYAKANLHKLQDREAKKSVKKAQVAQVLGTTRNLASIIKHNLPDDHPCPYCGVEFGTDYHADHIYPVSKGGQSREENMVNVCSSCNLKKRDMTLTNFILVNDMNRELIEDRLRQLGKEF